MKVLFSEFAPDYSRYLYPYVVWGLPEAGETPADLYAAGFHPASPNLDRFTLCRHLRVPLAGFVPSSENRRILRKGEGLRLDLVPRADFAYTPGIRTAWLAFAEQRFGPGIMPAERLDGLLAGRVVSHLLTARDPACDHRVVGTVLLYLEPPRMAHYYYAFYDLTHANRSLGLFLMTAAVGYFRAAGFAHLYLGTCYSERALYKTQFAGIEFFNGLAWSSRLDELKMILHRDARARHLLQEPEFLAFHDGLETLATSAAFQLVPSSRRLG
jgi:hypothetical protein